MKGFYTILLLIVSNVFMTFAWYGHLKMKQEYSWFAALPLIGVITFSWVIAFFEYSCQIPAESYRLCREWRSILADAVESDSRGDYFDYFYCFTTVFFKGRNIALEPSGCICLPDCSCLFCVYEIIVSATLKQRLRLASTEVLFYINGGSIRMKWSLRLYAYLQSIFLFGIRHISFIPSV